MISAGIIQQSRWIDAQVDLKISAYLAVSFIRAVAKVGGRQLNVAATVMVQPYAQEVLSQEHARPAQRRQVLRAAILFAPTR